MGNDDRCVQIPVLKGRLKMQLSQNQFFICPVRDKHFTGRHLTHIWKCGLLSEFPVGNFLKSTLGKTNKNGMMKRNVVKKFCDFRIYWYVVPHYLKIHYWSRRDQTIIAHQFIGGKWWSTRPDSSPEGTFENAPQQKSIFNYTVRDKHFFGRHLPQIWKCGLLSEFPNGNFLKISAR